MDASPFLGRGTHREKKKWHPALVVAPVLVLTGLGAGPSTVVASRVVLARQVAPSAPIAGSLVAKAAKDPNSSPNWAGDALVGSTFTSVAGSWREPSATCPNDKSSQSVFWVGLDGYSSPTVEQIGTDAVCIKEKRGPVTGYHAWYEMYPLPGQFLDPATYPVAPGDLLQASVSVENGSYDLSITDVGHWTFSTTQAAPAGAQDNSAEWIAEAPSVCGTGCHQVPLTDFGSVSFSGLSANGLEPAATGAKIEPITMERNSRSTPRAVPSPATPDGGFTINWMGP